ncbi:GNAT family N-acetyltransferase [Nocardioides limicola]|uniref:GNAT family N-acetyltransferase n=1 Tax=Nocardioides limicola TaxID=2803368 RepID=UPI00193B0988|nr:GNAT family N-acetyltransferase [Nocardioides sp. DJM-14]
MTDTAIRRIQPDDLTRVVELVHELADYEKAPHECHLTVEQLRDALFGDNPALFGHVATVDDDVVGVALWFLNFSTWRGTHGIYLEDLYVRPGQRGLGLGQRLLQALAQECVARGFERLEWSVLDWNEPAIGFYRSLGAVGMDEWTVHRLTGDALQALGGQ